MRTLMLKLQLFNRQSIQILIHSFDLEWFATLRAFLALIIIANFIICLLTLQAEDNFTFGAFMRIDRNTMTENAFKYVHNISVAFILMYLVSPKHNLRLHLIFHQHLPLIRANLLILSNFIPIVKVLSLIVLWQLVRIARWAKIVHFNFSKFLNVNYLI